MGNVSGVDQIRINQYIETLKKKGEAGKHDLLIFQKLSPENQLSFLNQQYALTHGFTLFQVNCIFPGQTTNENNAIGLTVEIKDLRKQGQDIAKKLHDYSGKFGSVNRPDFVEQFNKINKDNVIDVIEAYNKKSPNKSLIKMISDKIGDITGDDYGGGSQNTCKKDVNKIFNCLVQKAETLGINVNYFKNEFKTELDAQYNKTIGWVSTEKLDSIINAVILLIMNKSALTPEEKEKIKKTDTGALQQKATADLKERGRSAQSSFNNEVKYDGWAGSVANSIKGLWGSENRTEVVRANLTNFNLYVNKLEEAQKEGPEAYSKKFKEIFRIDFNAENMAIYKKIEQQYKAAMIFSGIEENYQETLKNLLKNPNLLPDSGMLASTTVYNRELNNFAQFLGQGDVQKGIIQIEAAMKEKGLDPKNASLEKKYSILHNLAVEYQKKLHSNTMTITGGKNLDQITKDYNASYNAAFGIKNDIVKQVTQYNLSQQAGAAVVKGAVVMVGSIAIGVATGGSGLAFFPALLATAGATAAITAEVDITDRLSSGYVLQSVQDGYKKSGIIGAVNGFGKGAQKVLSREEIEKILKNAGISGATVIAGGLLGSGIELAGKTLQVGQVIKGAALVTGDALVGIGAEYLQTGTITVQGTIFSVTLSAAGQIVAIYKIGQINKNNPKALAEEINNAKATFKLSKEGPLTKEALEKALQAYLEAHPNLEKAQMDKIRALYALLDDSIKPTTISKSGTSSGHPENNESGVQPKSLQTQKAFTEAKEEILSEFKGMKKSDRTPLYTPEELNIIAQKITPKNKDVFSKLAKLKDVRGNEYKITELLEKITPNNQDIIFDIVRKIDPEDIVKPSNLTKLADKINAQNKKFMSKVVGILKTEDDFYYLSKAAEVIPADQKFVLKILEIKDGNDNSIYSPILERTKSITSENKDIILKLAKMKNPDGTYAFSNNLDEVVSILTPQDKNIILELAEMKNSDGVYFLASKLELIDNPKQFLEKFKSFPSEHKKLIGDILGNQKIKYINIDDFTGLTIENLKLVKQFASTSATNAGEILSLARSLNGSEYFFKTTYRDNFEGLNEIVYGKKQQWMIDKIAAFEKETGIKIHVDNNVTEEVLSENMYYIESFLKNNQIKGIKSVNEIYITNFIKERAGGVYNGGETIYVRPSSQYSSDPNLRRKTFFYETLNHENAHYLDALKGNKLEGADIMDVADTSNISSIETDSRLKDLISRNVREYAATNRDEFIACLNEEIEKGTFYVVKITEGPLKGKLVLRKYLKNGSITDKLNNITQAELDEIVRLYLAYNGPNLVPTAPLDTSLRYIESVISD